MYNINQLGETLNRIAETVGCTNYSYNHREYEWNRYEICFYFTYKGKGKRIRAAYCENSSGLENIYYQCFKKLKGDFLDIIGEINRPSKLLLLC